MRPAGRGPACAVETFGNLVDYLAYSCSLSKPVAAFFHYSVHAAAIHGEMWAAFKEIETSDTTQRAREYGDKVKGSGAELNCHVVDTWKVLSGGMDKKGGKYLSDGLHLNETGNRLDLSSVHGTIAGKVSSPGAHGRRR
jgi:hypothetical protein